MNEIKPGTRTVLPMMVNGKMANIMDKAPFGIPVALCMKGLLLKVNDVAKAN